MHDLRRHPTNVNEGRLQALWIMVAMSFALSACSTRCQPSFMSKAKGSTTLDLGTQQEAARDVVGLAVVARGQISQQWHAGFFEPASVTLPDVKAGDAIVTLGIYWGDLSKRAKPAPTDSSGTFVAVVDQGPGILGRAKPYVFAQVHVELQAAPGRHVITPPELGGPAGDGTLYVLQVRGLKQRTEPVAVGQVRATGTVLSDVTVNLAGDVQVGDLAIAIGGYDNTAVLPEAGITDPPADWISAGAQQDATNNVPSEVCHRVVTQAGRQRLSWTWKDPDVNVACAAMVVLR